MVIDCNPSCSSSCSIVAKVVFDKIKSAVHPTAAAATHLSRFKSKSAVMQPVIRPNTTLPSAPIVPKIVEKLNVFSHCTKPLPTTDIIMANAAQTALKAKIRIQRFVTSSTNNIKISGTVWWPVIPSGINRKEFKTICDVKKPVLLLVHQWSKMGGAGQLMEGMAHILALKHQYTTITFDLRGAGQSSGTSTWSGYDEIGDVVAVAQWIRLNLARPIVIIGSSAGAPIAGSALGHSDCSYVVGGVFIGYTFGFLSSFIFGSHYKNITQCAKPKLFIMGDSDGFTSVNQLNGYIVKCKGEINDCFIEPNIGHFGLESPEFDEKICGLIHDFVTQRICDAVNMELWHDRLGGNHPNKGTQEQDEDPLKENEEEQKDGNHAMNTKNAENENENESDGGDGDNEESDDHEREENDTENDNVEKVEQSDVSANDEDVQK